MIGTGLVSEWWYLGTLLVASAFGFAGVAGWPTYTTPGVVPYGVALALVFVYVLLSYLSFSRPNCPCCIPIET